jgi:hypothetical protein
MSVEDGDGGRRTSGQRIFLSYRRDDSSGYAVHLYEDLAERFGAENVFMDIDSLAPGVDFVDAIQETLERCDTVLVLIGRGWLSASGSDGSRRLDNPEDFVRLEIEAALDDVHRVVPVLVAGAEMPSRAELPASLAALARRHAVDISDRRWRADSGSLMDALERSWRVASPPEKAPEPQPVQAGAQTPSDPEPWETTISAPTPNASAVPASPEPVNFSKELVLLVSSDQEGGFAAPVATAAQRKRSPGARGWIAIIGAVIVTAAVVLGVTLSGTGGRHNALSGRTDTTTSSSSASTSVSTTTVPNTAVTSTSSSTTLPSNADALDVSGAVSIRSAPSSCGYFFSSQADGGGTPSRDRNTSLEVNLTFSDGATLNLWAPGSAGTFSSPNWPGTFGAVFSDADGDGWEAGYDDPPYGGSGSLTVTEPVLSHGLIKVVTESLTLDLTLPRAFNKSGGAVHIRGHWSGSCPYSSQ